MHGRRLGNALKRCSDILIASLAVVLLSPVMIIIAMAVWIKLGRPVLFMQGRPGLNGKPFTMYKFRTMSNANDAEGNMLPDELRMTALGRFLRSTSLDELPEFLNVLKGDMSLVGPRPLLMEYLERYTPQQARRHEVRPGITGWAQINGRNAISWESKFDLDVWYVDNWSHWLDIKILCLTIGTIIRRDGVTSDGHATAPLFSGTQEGEQGGTARSGRRQIV